MTDPVDLALLLAFDGSASVGFDEFGMMATGVAQALRDRVVLQGLVGGPHRSALCAVLLWSGHDEQHVSVPWTRIANSDDLAGFATLLQDLERAISPGTTAIGSALLACDALFGALPAPASRRVLDVVGDGRSNDGPPPAPIRNRLIGQGIVINGLCVLHEEADLIASYTQEVIGGIGAFALPCQNFAAFADAMQEKLVREVAGGANPDPFRA